MLDTAQLVEKAAFFERGALIPNQISGGAQRSGLIS